MIQVKSSFKDMTDAIDNLIERAAEDYSNRIGKDWITDEGCSTEIFKASFDIIVGRKYIKILSGDSVWAFIVKEDDSLFKRGDILKPASFNQPAKNKARGNVLEGNFPIQWTGPLYLQG